jgi:tRNA threonylcarbamoyladenosine biosynthesis protein TsaE
MLVVSSESPAETMAVGRRLASLLRAGDVLLLEGELGAGKTTLVAGIAEGLGVDETVVSPSFILSRTYEGLIPLTHADAYRLESLGELDDLALTEEADAGVLVVEWGTAVEQSLPPDTLVIKIEVAGESSRKLHFRPRGTWERRPLTELQP